MRTCGDDGLYQRALPAVLEGPHFLLSGGLQIDGSEIASINAAQVEDACGEIKRQVQKMIMSVSLQLRWSAGYPRSCRVFRVRPYRL